MRGNQIRLLWVAAIAITAATAYSGRMLFLAGPQSSTSVHDSASSRHSVPSQPESGPRAAYSASRNPYRLWTHSNSTLDGMHEGNWRECLAAVRPETLVAGTKSWSEWQTALYRAGMQGRRIAVEELLAIDRSEGDAFSQSSEVFAGWASTEPEAAWDWLADSSDERLRSALLPRLTPSVAEVPEEMAIEQFTNLPTEQKTARAAVMMQDLLETGGYDAADSLLDREASAETGDPAALVVLQTLFDTVAAQREEAMKNGGSVEDAADWLASYADRPFVRVEHFSIVASELGARMGPESAAEWLASMASEDAAEAVKSALADTIQQWIAMDRAAADTWLKTQEDHPSYGMMALHLKDSRRAGVKAVIAKP